jgi:UDP-N-acetyl-D-mannosaminuronic acid transferase (WecB/TagA/CpsF family)
MDSIEIASIAVDGVRFDFPSEKQMVALVSAWDDDTNHQISFLRKSDLLAARQVSEYGSMIASADLVLPASDSLSDLAAHRVRVDRTGRRVMERRWIPIGERRREYLSYFGPPEEDEMTFKPYLPLKTLSLCLSALEQRKGSVFLVGGSIPTLQKAEMNVRSTFPELRVVGRSTGDYSEENEPAIMRALQKSTPDMVIVGSMVKDAELWVTRHMRFTRSGIFFYEGPILEILAGRR